MDSIEAVLDMPKMRATLADLEEQAAAPDLWDDQEKAQQVTSKLSHVQGDINRVVNLRNRLDDLEIMVELGREEGGSADGLATLADAETELGSIEKAIGELEVRTLLNG